MQIFLIKGRVPALNTLGKERMEGRSGFFKAQYGASRFRHPHQHGKHFLGQVFKVLSLYGDFRKF